MIVARQEGHNEKDPPKRVFFDQIFRFRWRPHGDSNPGRNRERVVS